MLHPQDKILLLERSDKLVVCRVDLCKFFCGKFPICASDVLCSMLRIGGSHKGSGNTGLCENPVERYFGNLNAACLCNFTLTLPNLVTPVSMAN